MEQTQKLAEEAQIAADCATPSGTKEISLIEMLTALGFEKKSIVWTTIAAGVIGLAISFLLPPLYTSKTVLMPPQQDKSNLGALAGLSALAGLGGDGGLKTPNDMYIGFLGSDTVANDLIARFDLQKHYDLKTLEATRKKLRSRVAVNSDKKSGFITVETSDGSPQFASRLANAYIDSLRTLLNRLAVTDAQQRRVFFQQRVDETKLQLKQAELKLDEARHAGGVASIDEQMTSAIRSSAELRTEISAKEVQLQVLRSYATEENPDVQRLVAAIAAMREQLNSLEKGAATDESSAAASGKSVAYGNVGAYREVKYQQATLDRLEAQLALAQIDEAKEGPLVQQVDVAVPSEKRSSPKRVFITVGAAIAGMIFALFRALARTAVRRDPALAAKLVRLRQAWRFRSPLKDSA